MEAKILSYRRGRHTEHVDQFVVAIKGVETKDDARKYVGRRIYWETPRSNKISGKITKTHGSSGAVLARFERGLPGQALGTDAVVE